MEENLREVMQEKEGLEHQVVGFMDKGLFRKLKMKRLRSWKGRLKGL